MTVSRQISAIKLSKQANKQKQLAEKHTLHKIDEEYIY